MVIGAVDKDGPADIAGIHAKDILQEINNIPINDSTRFFTQFEKLNVGQVAKFKIFRDGRSLLIDVRIGAVGFSLDEVIETLNIIEEKKKKPKDAFKIHRQKSDEKIVEN